MRGYKDFSGITSIKVDTYLRHDYFKKIQSHLSGKIVLDVGCIDDGSGTANEIRLWNHWFVKQIASETLGIDLRAEPLKQLKKLGFNVKKMDAQHIQSTQKFDVVFAGELIEHLPNPGLFLVNAANALKKGGQIILSTPNPFSLSRIVRIFQLWTNEPPVNPDHTMYLSPQNCKTLAVKCGLKVRRVEYAHFPFSHPGLLVMLNEFFCKIIGENFKEQLIIFINKQ